MNLVELYQTDVPNNYYTFIKNVMYESTIKAAEGNTVAVVRNVTLIKDVCLVFKMVDSANSSFVSTQIWKCS